MGTYVYRVTAKRVMCSDGVEANVGKFAYKPTYSGWDADKTNARWHFSSGATSSDAMAARGNITDRVVMGDEHGVVFDDTRVFENLHHLGSFEDGLMDSPNYFKALPVTVVGAKPAKKWEVIV